MITAVTRHVALGLQGGHEFAADVQTFTSHMALHPSIVASAYDTTLTPHAMMNHAFCVLWAQH